MNLNKFERNAVRSRVMKERGGGGGDATALADVSLFKLNATEAECLACPRVVNFPF